MKKLIAAVVAVLPLHAFAVPVTWTDWVSADANTASGTLNADGTDITVTSTSSSAYAFVQTDSGTNYWTEPNAGALPYTGGDVDNAPFGPDIIALNGGGEVTITFSEAVQDPYVALVSWNGNTATTSAPFEVISFGQGFWGNGSFADLTSTGFVGSGELHGIIRFSGTFTEISFSHTSENWHGFTVGIAGLADDGGGDSGGGDDGGDPPANDVPEPGPLGVLGLSLLILGLARRRRQG